MHRDAVATEPGIGRRLLVGLLWGLSAGVSGALLGYVWVAFSGVDMGMWVLARSTGIAAYVLLTAVTILGLLLSAPRVRATRIFSVAQRLRLHISLTLFAFALVIAHIVVLAMDPWANVGWAGALLPFGSEYRPLPVTLGLLSLWLGLLTGISAALAGRFSGRFWLILHRTAGGAWLLAWLHGLFAGSDTQAWLALYVVSGLLVIATAVYRFSGTTKKDRLRELADERQAQEVMP